MAANSRFAMATHIMLELGFTPEGELKNSSQLASGANTNPVVIRRILSELQKAGLVSTASGKSGGARMAKKPSAISLYDIYAAVDEGSLFAHNPNDPNKKCELSCHMAELLNPIFSSAASALERELSAHKLSRLMDLVKSKCPSREKLK